MIVCDVPIDKYDNLIQVIEDKAKIVPNDIVFWYTADTNNYEKVVEKTYKQVYESMIKIASYINHTYGTNKHIAIVGNNSFDWILTYLGIMASNNICVPINQDMSIEDIKHHIKLGEVTYIIVSEEMKPFLSNYNIITMHDLIENSEKDGNITYKLPNINSNQLANIFFTSGTAGTEYVKAVMLSHKNIISGILQSVNIMQEDFNSYIAIISYAHIYGSVIGIFAPYVYGCKVYINQDIKQLDKDLKFVKPDGLMVVPVFIEIIYKKMMMGIKKANKEKTFEKGLKLSKFLLKFGIDKRRKIFKDLLEPLGSNMRGMIVGGAALSPNYIQFFDDIGIILRTGYGTTETCASACANRQYAYKDTSVGTPLLGTEVKIAEDGEILLKGPQIMMGYYKNEIATQEVLKDGWYSTGDLGMMDEDGYVYITGRKNNLIVLNNGENISPESIEDYFMTFEGVLEIIVYHKDNLLIAEIVSTSNEYDKSYFEDIKNKYNNDKPLYAQINKIILRKEKFKRNVANKIIRNQVQ